MAGSLAAVLLRVLRVPPEPRVPEGATSSVRVFRAGANFWRLRLLGWAGKQAASLLGIVVVTLFLSSGPTVARAGGVKLPPAEFLGFMRIVESLAVALFVVQLPLTYWILRLDYEMRWYIVTDRAVRLREGVLRLNEMTLTLANVQDVSVRQGPLERLLGLADVELRTAGGSEPRPGQGHGHVGENLHLARLRGVDDANALRDMLVERMKAARGAGLGDADDAQAGEPAPTVLSAVLALRAESAALRSALAGE